MRSRLEKIIRAFDGAVVIVSHDRYLLDETVTEVAELDGGRSSSGRGIIPRTRSPANSISSVTGDFTSRSKKR